MRVIFFKESFIILLTSLTNITSWTLDIPIFMHLGEITKEMEIIAEIKEEGTMCQDPNWAPDDCYFPPSNTDVMRLSSAHIRKIKITDYSSRKVFNDLWL
ncbi:hypothetical protein KIL84_017521 [Mauremys mutica]|uniref:Uncharacterized protein n=1 Tax=Mauremys mutica TaxID=74926 RepID=A0A9D4ARQ3_9SAUR|nr:hypothetical protein KIL84_017521 [Mauremys mutica]